MWKHSLNPNNAKDILHGEQDKKKNQITYILWGGGNVKIWHTAYKTDENNNSRMHQTIKQNMNLLPIKN